MVKLKNKYFAESEIYSNFADWKKKSKSKFLTENQREYYNILTSNQITICSGPAGVGKSYIAMKAAVDLLMEPENGYEKIIIVRPAVEAEEKLGALPGNLEEKLDPYIFPSYYLLNKIIGKENREKLKERVKTPPASFFSSQDEFEETIEFINEQKNNSNQLNDSRKKVIVYAGNIGEGQGLDKIIPQAAKLLGNKFHFLIIGDGGTKNLLQSAIEKMEIHNVVLKNPISRKCVQRNICGINISFYTRNST